jgi:hypothetical protein
MLACFHVQVQYAGQLLLYSLQRSKGKHNRSLKVAVHDLVLWPTPYTYIILEWVSDYHDLSSITGMKLEHTAA